jgi:hypothetical protein
MARTAGDVFNPVFIEISKPACLDFMMKKVKLNLVF